MLEVGNCSNAYKSHDILAMEALMGSIQQPPPSSFSFRDLSWWVELRQTCKHDIGIDTMRKRVYVAHVSWVRVPNFLVGEKNRGDVQCRFIRKDHRANSVLKNPKPNNNQEGM
jgi:hypothetical protein